MASPPSLQKLLKNLQRQFGEGSVQCFGDRTPSSIPTFSSGSISLDRALGGGIPRGRVIEVFGHESSGKTTLCLHAVASVQRLGGLAAFVDVEHAFDPTYAARIGVDLGALLVSQPDSGEQALDITEGLIASGAVEVVVVDSVAALTPRAEIEGEMGAHHLGLQARLMSQALRKLTAIAHRHRCTLLFVNQIRYKIGVVFGSPETTPGGNALKFFSSVRLKARKRGVVKRGDDPIGIEVRVKVVKNKVAPPFREAQFELHYDRGIHAGRELLEQGVLLGIVEKSGAWYSYGGDRLGQGRDRACAHLEEHPDLEKQIREALAGAGGLQAASSPPPDPASLRPDSIGQPDSDTGVDRAA